MGTPGGCIKETKEVGQSTGIGLFPRDGRALSRLDSRGGGLVGE
jgi:hypothetical protein